MVINEWPYFQMRHFVEKLPQPIRSGEDLRPLEQLCTMVKSINNISRIYKILLATEEMEVPPYIKKWEKELGSQWKKHNI